MRYMTKKTMSGLFGTFAYVASYGAVADDTRQEPGANVAVLEEVIVTAQKRNEDIQTVPMSMSAISQDQLERLHATELADYAGYVPGLQIQTNGSPAQATISLRGIAPLGSSATVSTYIDDTPLGSSSIYGGAVGTAGTVLDLLPFDFQSFEVLRGPQGTLYGASALGGLIKYVSRAPDLQDYSVLAGVDTFSLAGAGNAGAGGHLRVNLPLVPGQLGISASYAQEDTPGYIDNAISGARRENPYRQQAGRFALLWKPIEDLSVSLSAIKQHIHSDDEAYVALDPTTLQPIYGGRQNNNYVPQPFIQNLNYFTLALDWDLGWADLRSASSYSETTSDQIADATLEYGVLFGGISAFQSHLSLYKTTEELRLTSKPGGPVEWLVGTFYTRENSVNNQLATAQSFDGTAIPGLNPLVTAGLPSLYREYAVFGDLTYKITQSFDVTAGLRWARNEQDFTQISAGAGVPAESVPGSSSQGVVTYSVSPRWHLSDSTMTYARVASGYQPGGPNLLLPDVPRSVDASRLTNYEVGLKTVLDAHRLTVDAAVFYIDWNKIIVGTSNGVANFLVNGGTASSRGVELTTEYLPIPDLRLELNAAYADAKLTQDIPSIGGLSGDQLPFSPKASGSALADYAFLHSGRWTARAGGGLRYVGNRVTTVNHSPLAIPLKSYTAVDLNTSLSDEHWTIRLFVKNLGNKNAYISANALQSAATGALTEVTAVPLQPRVIGVALDAKF